jgi:hypothetical protein
MLRAVCTFYCPRYIQDTRYERNRSRDDKPVHANKWMAMKYLILGLLCAMVLASLFGYFTVSPGDSDQKAILMWVPDGTHTDRAQTPVPD